MDRAAGIDQVVPGQMKGARAGERPVVRDLDRLVARDDRLHESDGVGQSVSSTGVSGSPGCQAQPRMPPSQTSTHPAIRRMARIWIGLPRWVSAA